MLYKQCKLEYDGGVFEVSWIPEIFAHANRSIIVDRDTMSYHAVVREVYGKGETKEMVEINITHPLRKVTDI